VRLVRAGGGQNRHARLKHPGNELKSGGLVTQVNWNKSHWTPVEQGAMGGKTRKIGWDRKQKNTTNLT